MKVFKFGGASVKDAESLRNVEKVLSLQGFSECLLVVSAMGNHIDIAHGLFPKEHSVYEEISLFFDDIDSFLRRNKSPNYNFVYDQVVSCGELISSKILSMFLNERGFLNQWIDARDYIKTDNTYREGMVNWEVTEQNIKENIECGESFVTQGFIGSDENNFTTTLGREGSDYSAAIFAYCLSASAMTIWKDVPGVMTGDPRVFENVSLLHNISYEEAIEMAYYGASVIHPKTLQPLKRKNIPFFVKSFVEPEKAGTKVGNSAENHSVESYILKDNQILLKIATKDFSFVAEEHLSLIFSLLAKYKIKISLMQNSAISLALCLEDKYHHLEELNDELSKIFNTEITKEVSLFTVRNADMENLSHFYDGKIVLLEQISQHTLQMVTL